jgi:hypothetical protein
MATRTEEGTREASGGVAVVSASKISQLTGHRTPAAWRVNIAWTCPGSRWLATGWYMEGSVQAGGASRPMASSTHGDGRRGWGRRSEQRLSTGPGQ